MSTPKYLHRDISWLSFNYRVLQEAKDPGVPLFERIKFLAIYSSNLDEFFRVRVAQHKNLLRVSKKTKKELDYDPKALMREIHSIVNKQQEEFSRIYDKIIIPELKLQGIRLLRRLELNQEQKDFVEAFFDDNMLPFVQPVLLVKNKIRPWLNNGALYITLLMHDKTDANHVDQYAIVKLPSDHLPRFIELPSAPGKHDLIMLDDIVRHNVSDMFPGYFIEDAYSIKLTRDAELYIDDEFSGDLMTKIKASLTRRQVGPPSRFVIDRSIPPKHLRFLMESFELEKDDILKEGRYHNNVDFFKFPDFGLSTLKNIALPPLPYPELEQSSSMVDSIAKKDHLLYFPYQSYESVVRFFEQAAKDPKVTHIKITQYRVAKKSRIMQALMDAVKAGKQVFAFVEVKARFDEEANIVWGEKLEKAGVRVHYSLPGVKIHAKLGLIRREEEDGVKLYTYLSTGNFHEDTAKIYSDYGFFTSNEAITTEVARIFSYLENIRTGDIHFKNLLVGQFNLRSSLSDMIRKEIAHAKAGKKAIITLKMNSLQDQEMVDLLYQASAAGVEVKLIIRGICSIVTQEKGLSENINAISIVDRFLEHARVFIFYNDGQNDTYLSSADWMVRNLSYRIESAFPIYDPVLKREIQETIDLQWNDNVKARILNASHTNPYKPNDKGITYRSQIETYYRLKRKLEASQESKEEEE